MNDILPLDVALALPEGRSCRLHHSRGCDDRIDDFEPLETTLEPGTELRLAPFGGKSSSRMLPFFNLEFADRGVIAAIGWSGGWAVTFSRRDGVDPGGSCHST